MPAYFVANAPMSTPQNMMPVQNMVPIQPASPGPMTGPGGGETMQAPAGAVMLTNNCATFIGPGQTFSYAMVGCGDGSMNGNMQQVCMDNGNGADKGETMQGAAGIMMMD